MMVHQYLQAYFPTERKQVLEYEGIQFSFDPDSSATISAQKRKIKKVVDYIAKCVYRYIFPAHSCLILDRKKYDRIVVFLHTHSDPDTGALHCQINRGASLSVDQVWIILSISNCLLIQVALFCVVLSSIEKDL
jgi:hypothetical protein